MLNVDALQDGIVIDHIKVGFGKEIYDMLHLEKKKDVSVALLQMYEVKNTIVRI